MTGVAALRGVRAAFDSFGSFATMAVEAIASRMSASPRKRTNSGQSRYVRFVPISDICSAASSISTFARRSNDFGSCERRRMPCRILCGLLLLMLEDLFRALVRGASNAAYTIDIFSRGLGANEAGQNHEPEPRAIGEFFSRIERANRPRRDWSLVLVVPTTTFAELPGAIVKIPELSCKTPHS